MEQQNGFARKTYYSQELKHQICNARPCLK